MRDPLQTEPALDELLELPPHPSKQDVYAAFARAIAQPGRRADVTRLTEARRKLVDPVERALLCALRYDDTWLRGMDPCPLHDPGCLVGERRAQTTQRWESTVRDRFPDLAATHCLAVSWYWWAVAASRGTSALDGADLPTLWSGAIAYWAALIADSRFTHTLLESSPGAEQDLARRLVEQMRTELHAALLAAPTQPGVAGLDAKLTTEVRSARISATVPGPAAPLGAGVLLLQRLGRDQAMRQLVEQSGRQDDDARWLAGMLSPFGQIVAMLDARRFDDALVALEALPPDRRGSADASALLRRAYTMRAKHQLEVGQVAAALDSFELAHAQATGEAREEIRQAVKAAAKGLAAKSSTRTRSADETIAVLERAHRIVGDDQVAALLADRLTERGVHRFREGQDKLEKSQNGATEAIKRRLRSGMQDLKKARSLGSARAAEQLEVAEKFYQAVLAGQGGGQSGGALIPAKAQGHMRRAEEAAKQEKWDEAVSQLRLAAKAMGTISQREIKAALAVVLVNRAMATANAAISKANAAVSSAPSGAPPIAELFSVLTSLDKALEDLQEAKREDPHVKGVDRHIEHVRANRTAINNALGLPSDFGPATGPTRTSPTPRRRVRVGKVLQWAVMLAVTGLMLYGLNVLYTNSSAWRSVIEGTFVVLWVLFMILSVFKR